MDNFNKLYALLIEDSFPDIEPIKHRYTYMDYGEHRLDFFNNKVMLGAIEWNIDDGEVSKLDVAKNLRKKDMASYIWEFATDFSIELGLHPPNQSSREAFTNQ